MTIRKNLHCLHFSFCLKNSVHTAEVVTRAIDSEYTVGLSPKLKRDDGERTFLYHMFLKGKQGMVKCLF